MMRVYKLLIAVLATTSLIWATERHFYLAIDQNFEMPAPAGTTLSAWAFHFEDGPSSIPGPTIQVTQGDLVYFHFHNTSDQPQSIHFHGLDVEAANDGFPTISNTIQPGATGIFHFTAYHVGNFAYVALGNGPISRQMGLYGLIKVRIFDLEPEYDLPATGIDPTWHSSTPPTDLTQYDPTYMLIDGQVADTQHTIALISENPVAMTDTVRLNFYNDGFWPQAIHFPAGSARIISSDGRTWPNDQLTTQLNIYPGERYTVRLNLPNPGEYSGQWSLLNPLTNEPAQTITWTQTVVDFGVARGDLNGDEVINVQDVVQLVSIILGDLTPTPTQLYAADLNEDQAVDVTDVVSLVHLILGL